MSDEAVSREEMKGTLYGYVIEKRFGDWLDLIRATVKIGDKSIEIIFNDKDEKLIRTFIGKDITLVLDKYKKKNEEHYEFKGAYLNASSSSVGHWEDGGD